MGLSFGECHITHRGVSEKAEVRAALLAAHWLAIVLRPWWPNLVALHFKPEGLGDACTQLRQACTLSLISLGLLSLPRCLGRETAPPVVFKETLVLSRLLSPVGWVRFVSHPPHLSVPGAVCSGLN